MTTIEARVIQKIATESEWNANNQILYKGEMALVKSGDYVVNIKVGDGINPYSRLNYIYNGSVLGSVDTTSDGSTRVDGVYSARTSGTYTNLGGLVAKEGYYTLFRKSGNTWSLETEVLFNDSILGNNLDNAIETIGNTLENIKIDTYDSSYMSNTFSINTESMMLSESVINADDSNLLYIEANFQSSGIVTLFVTDIQITTVLKIITINVKSGFGRYYLNTVSLDRQNRIGISKDSEVKIRKCTSTVTGDETEFVRSLVVTGNIQVGSSIGYSTSVNQILEMKYAYIYK